MKKLEHTALMCLPLARFQSESQSDCTISIRITLRLHNFNPDCNPIARFQSRLQSDCTISRLPLDTFPDSFPFVHVHPCNFGILNEHDIFQIFARHLRKVERSKNHPLRFIVMHADQKFVMHFATKSPLAITQ